MSLKQFALGPLCCSVALLLSITSAFAQQPTPPGVERAAFAARRFPQSVRVGDLLQRPVLLPVESRPLLGHVLQVIRLKDGSDVIVMTYGGFLGFGGRRIAVPTDAMVLVGEEIEVLDFSPAQLKTFPTYEAENGAVPRTANESIRMGLAHPSH